MQTDEPTPPVPSPSTSRFKIALLIVLAVAAVIAASLLIGTERGREILHDPHKLGVAVQAWVKTHWLIAPLCLILIYTVLTMLSLPIWWLPIPAGYGFGLVMGIVWAQLSFTIAAVVTASVSRFLLADWFRARVDTHAGKIHTLVDKAGHNGLLVVCGVRMLHVVPAGLSNYVFGLTKISLLDVAIGTFIGGLPGGTLGVTFGAAGHLLHDWRYVTFLVILNIIPIAGLVLRYIKPDWFRSIGIE